RITCCGAINCTFSTQVNPSCTQFFHSDADKRARLFRYCILYPEGDCCLSKGVLVLGNPLSPHSIRMVYSERIKVSLLEVASSLLVVTGSVEVVHPPDKKPKISER